ncbi:DUF6988 family protein [Luteimonas panaciterrae]|uniref:DUF6988 family protein n=1 Tax=Luteimonas panaciterrae TaxID=363885 RepID=UPI001CFB936A|nr:hypothetical protein [Luteimonas panaciterrae]
MDAEERAELHERLEQSFVHSELLHRMAPSEFQKPVRRMLSRCATSVALEHHSAVLKLIESGHFASAAAMLRPVMEAGAIAHWLLYAAPTERVQAMSQAPLEGARRDDDTPVLSVLIRELADALPSLPGLANLQEILRSPAGSWLNKYTHGGIPQLRRKGPDAQPFGLPDMILALIRADMFVLMACAAATVIYDVPELDAYVPYKRKALFDEMVEKFDLSIPFDEWAPLPKQILIDAWDEQE